jgi:hypothetical protein
MSKKLEALLSTLGGKDATKCAVIHAAYEDTPRTVALIDFPADMAEKDMLERAFMYTNSINASWYTGNKVEYIGPGKACRSTSVGDMVLLGNKKFKCEARGWKEMKNSDSAHKWSKI